MELYFPMLENAGTLPSALVASRLLCGSGITLDATDLALVQRLESELCLEAPQRQVVKWVGICIGHKLWCAKTKALYFPATETALRWWKVRQF